MDRETDQIGLEHGPQTEHTNSSDSNNVVQQPLDDGNSEPAAGMENNHQAAEDSELEVVETDDDEEEEVEEITIIELSDTEIREEDEEDDSEEEEEVVIKQEPVDDFAEGQGQEFVDFDPSQLGVIVTQTELPEDLIGEPISGVHKCKFCPAKFDTRSRLIAHTERHINNGTIRKCRFCDFFTAMTQTLREHECKHTKEKPYECPTCGHRCRLKGDLTRHQETHTDRKRYHCKLCDHRTRTAGNLKKHMERHQPDMPRNFTCPLCDFAFKREAALRNHLNRRHNDSKPYFCDQCSFSCKTMWELNSHKARHSDDHPFSCTWAGCDKKFKTRSDCTKHIKRHTGTKNYECGVCHKRFFNATLLRKHMPTHSDVRNFECAECMKKFKTLRALKGHILTHKTIKPFPCTVCFKTFATQYNLDMHVRVHKSGRPYQCPICVHGSREMEHLMAHVGSEHLHNFTYVCSLCRKPFGKSFQLQLHMQRCHKEDMRGREESMVYEPDYLDFSFQSEPSGAFDPSTFAKYLAAEAVKALENNQSAGTGITIKQEPGLNNSFDGSGVSSSTSANSPDKDSGLPDSLQLPPVVQVGRYGGIPFCLARRNSGIQLNCQKKGKKPRRWFMDTSQMTEADAEKHKEYLRKKELGLLPYTYRRRRTNKSKINKKTNAKPKSSASGKAKGKRKPRRISWTVSEEDSDEDDVYFAEQLARRFENKGAGNQSRVEPDRSSSRARKPAVHFKNLPYDCFDSTHKSASPKKKAKEMKDSKADLSFLQPSTSLYVGGKTANRKRNKLITKKPPQKKSAKSAKKPPAQIACLPKQRRLKTKTNMRSGLGKKVKKEGVDMEKCWALALAGPLPVSHYKADETAINTQCWLNAVRSASARGRFGVSRSLDNKKDTTFTDQTSSSGDMREEFFSRFLQLQVRTPRDKTAGSSLIQSTTCTTIVQEQTGSEDAMTEDIVLEVKECVDDMVSMGNGDSSPTEVQVHENQTSSSADHHDNSVWQAATECLFNIVEIVCAQQDDEHHVPLHASQEYSVEINSTDTVEGDILLPSRLDTNDDDVNFNSDASDQTRKEQSNCVGGMETSSSMEFTSTEHLATREDGNSDSIPEKSHCEPCPRSRENSCLLAQQPTEKMDAAIEGDDGNQHSMQLSRNVSDTLKRSSATHLQPEESMVVSNTDMCPEVNMEFLHTKENGQDEIYARDSMESDAFTPTTSQHSGNMEVDQNGHHSQDENSSLPRSDVCQNSNGHKSPIFDFGHFESNETEQQPDKSNMEEACLTQQSQEAAVQEKRDEVSEKQSDKMIVENESGTESMFEENIAQKESCHDEKIPQSETCIVELYLDKKSRQDDCHGARLHSEDKVNEGESCSAEIQSQETSIREKCEITLQPEVNVSPRDDYPTENSSAKFPTVLAATTSSVAEMGEANLKEITKEVTAQVTNCTTHVPQNLAEIDGEVLPPSQSSSRNSFETCAPTVQVYPGDDSEQMPADNLQSSEELVHNAMAEETTGEWSVVENSVQLTKCLHVLVTDVGSHPCTSDYLHRLGVNKVSLNVHSMSAQRNNKLILKHRSQKTFKPKSDKKHKQTIFKSARPSKDKNQKADAQKLKQTKGKAKPVKPATTKADKKKNQKSNVKRPVTNLTSPLSGQDSGTTGIGALLLATAVAAKHGRSSAKTTPSKPGKSSAKTTPSKHGKSSAKTTPSKHGRSSAKTTPSKPSRSLAKTAPSKPSRSLAKTTPSKPSRSLAKTTPKPSTSKQKMSAGKALPKVVSGQKGKASSKMKRLTSKAKQLPAKNTSQKKKSSKQLNRGRKQTRIKKNVVKGLRYMKGLCGSNSAVTIKLEMEEPGDTLFCDAKKVGQGLDAGAADVLIHKRARATVDYFSISDRFTLHNISSDSHVSHKNITTVETVLGQDSNSERDCVADTPMIQTVGKSQTSTSKKKKTVRSSTKSPKSKRISLADPNCNEDTQTTENISTSSQNCVPETSVFSSDYHPAMRKMPVEVNMSAHLSPSNHILEASGTELETPAFEGQEFGARGSAEVVDTKPSSLAGVEGSALHISSNGSAPVVGDQIISDQGSKLPATVSYSDGNSQGSFSSTALHPQVGIGEDISHLSHSNTTVPVAPVENLIKPKKRGRPPKNKLANNFTSTVSAGTDPEFSLANKGRKYSRCTQKQPKAPKGLQTKKKPCTPKNNTVVKKTQPGAAVKACSRAQLQAKIKQAQTGFAKPRVKATMQGNVQATAASAITEDPKNSAYKSIKLRRRRTKNQSTQICEKDMCRKRKRYMYVETDTGELPDPPAKKRGRPPGPKIILDRSQANLCFGSPQALTEPEQADIYGAAEASAFGGEVSSLMLPGILQPSTTLGEPSAVCGQSEAHFSNTMLPPQYVQSVPQGNASALTSEAGLIQANQLTEYSSQLIDSEMPDIKPILSELGECMLPDVKPLIGEFSMMNQSTTQFMPMQEHVPAESWTTEQPLPQAAESSTSGVSMGEADDARAALLHALTQHFDMPETSPFDSHQFSQVSEPSSYPRGKPVVGVPVNRGRRKKSTDRTFCVQKRYRHASNLLLEDSERRRSDRPRKLRLTEEQIRQAAEKDSADSDIDNEEENNTYDEGNYHLAAGSEDVGSDIEFVRADYSHVDPSCQNLSLDDLRVNTFSLPDISEEGSAVGESSGLNIPGGQNIGGVATEAANVSEISGGELAHGENLINMDFGVNSQTFVSQQGSGLNTQAFVPQQGSGLNSQTFVSQQGSELNTEAFIPHKGSGLNSQTFISRQEMGNSTHMGQGYSYPMQSMEDSGGFVSNVEAMDKSIPQYHTQAGMESAFSSFLPTNHSSVIQVQTEQLKTQSPSFMMPKKFRVSAPLVPQMFTIKASKDECTLVSMDVPAQNYPAQYSFHDGPGGANIRRRQLPMSPQCQPSNQVEVPIGLGPSQEGSPSLTISVKTRDGKNVFLEDAPYGSS